MPSIVGGQHFGADRARHDGADFLQRFDIVAPGLGGQGGIGGDAIHQAAGGIFADFRHIGGIEKNFHGPVDLLIDLGMAGRSVAHERMSHEPPLKPRAAAGNRSQKPVVGVLLPLPLAGAYDYKLPPGVNAAARRFGYGAAGQPRNAGRGVGPGRRHGGRQPAENCGTAGRRARLCRPSLCDFIDWVADYTLNPPGAILAMALRSRGAFEPEARRIAYVQGQRRRRRACRQARKRALEVADDGLARSVTGLAEDANVSPAVVRGLVQAGALVATDLPEFAPFHAPDAGFCRAGAECRSAGAAATALREAVAAKKFSAHLLDGVTGSGKTEVYFEAVAAALARGKQVLILLPEIALTAQFLERFAARFGVRPAEWHSDLSQKERRRVYRAVMKGEARVVVGARSSLFLPFSELGLIIVDEEHEQAFKQQDGAIYHARDMAVVRARIEDCPVVLASATPSLESFVNATERALHPSEAGVAAWRGRTAASQLDRPAP